MGEKLTSEQKRQINMLRAELTKVRCWVTGFRAGRNNDLSSSVPGEDALRQTIMLFDELTKDNPAGRSALSLPSEGGKS